MNWNCNFNQGVHSTDFQWSPEQTYNIDTYNKQIYKNKHAYKINDSLTPPIAIAIAKYIYKAAWFSVKLGLHTVMCETIVLSHIIIANLRMKF